MLPPFCIAPAACESAVFELTTSQYSDFPNCIAKQEADLGCSASLTHLWDQSLSVVTRWLAQNAGSACIFTESQHLIDCMQGTCAAAFTHVHAAGKKPLLDTLDELHVSSLSDELNAQPDAPDASLHELHSKMDSHKPNPPNTKADDEQPASHQAAATPPSALSATAVAALTQLLNACLTQQAMPTLQDVMKDRQEKLESSGAAEYALPALPALPASHPGGVM